MNDQQHHSGERRKQVNWVRIFIAGTFVLLLVMGIYFIRVKYSYPSAQPDVGEAQLTGDTTAASNVIVDGKDKQSGLIAKGDYLLVKNTCTGCHSSKLILQAHFSEQTWIDKIRWMQAKQKLWDLGASEKPILAYLTKYYGPDSIHVAFRKPPLKDIKWYKLKD